MADTEVHEETEVGGTTEECDVCGQDHITEECPTLGLSTSDFKAQISRARLTVPHYLGVIDYPDGEVGIVAMEPISNKTQLGPFEAKKTCQSPPSDDVFFLKILSEDGNTICLDASNENHCNWMSLVQVAKTAEEQNCMAYQLGINIYFNTTQDIASGTPLKVWYATKYAQKLGKPTAPDGKTRSMLGEDMSSWPSETIVQSQAGEGLLEAAAYLTSVLPSSTASPSESMDAIVFKQEASPGQVYSCSKCPQVFFSQNDYAIHLRGHLMPASVQTHSRGGKRGRPWGRVGVTTPLGKRGPGRPRKYPLVKEPGEVTPKTDGPHKKRGRPRKVQTEQRDNESRDTSKDPAMTGDSLEGVSEEGAAETDKVQSAQVSAEVKESTTTPVDSEADMSLSGVVKPQSSQSGVLPDEEKPTPSAETDGDTASQGQERAAPPASKAQGDTPQSTAQSQTPSDVVKTPKRRGRPPKNKSVQKGEVTQTPGGAPDTGARSSRRVQPRRTLKGKRTSTFRYPGESSSEGEEEENIKGKNVLKKALKTKEYSDDDDDDDDRKGRGGEEMDMGVQITVQTTDGVILSKAPVILLDEDTGQAQALDPSTVSFVTTGVDGQQVMLIQSAAPTTTSTSTTTSTTTVMTEDQDTPAAATTATTSATTSTSTNATNKEEQVLESTDTPQDGLAALVDAALSSQKMEGGADVAIVTTEGGAAVSGVALEGGAALGRVKLEEEDGEDLTSDDPDWKGPAMRREGSPRKRRPKRRKGDDPDLEQLEESIQEVEGPNGTKEYACGVCAKRFQQLKYLKMHLPAHTDKFLCSDCGRRFARYESLQKHVCEDWLVLVEKIESDEDGSIIFRCKECNRCFPQMDHARRHASMHRGTWACNKCQRTFPKRQLLLEHKCGQPADPGEGGEESNPNPASDSTGEAAGEGDFACDICRQSFSNAKYLFRHMAMHTELFKCQSCGKCYSRKDSLQRHVLKCCPELADDYSVFACDKCKKTFGTRLGLENHVINCGKFQCVHCRIAFFSEDDLADHKCEGKIIDNAAGVQFPCKECGKTFASLPYLARHEASHHAAFECNICKKVFVRGEELSWHKPVCEGVHAIEQEGVTACPVCQNHFNEVQAFREHYQVHTHPYRCDRCGKRFIKVGTLHTHKCDNVVAGTTVEEGGLWQCEMCEKTFKNERYLARHKQLHGQPTFDCEYCGKKFIRRDYLNDHKCVLPDGTSVRVVRKKNRLYIRDDLVCPHCNKTFSSRSNLNKHIRVHGEKEAECHICGKKFHYHSYLKLHIATVHDRQFQYQCSHCGKILFSKTGLIAHIKQFHQETVKLYPCPKCGKTFRQKGNMRTHLYSHTKERTFKCEMCTKAFKYPDQLNRHRLEHTMSEKIKCCYCDKRFVRTSELKQHMRLFHSGIIYTCHVCHESCAHKHTIIRHYRRKHPEMADLFEKQPDFLDTLQKSADKATAIPAQRVPVQLTAPNRGGEQKPRIIRVMADGQEQEYIITTDPTTTAATATTAEAPGLQVGEEVLPYTTLTTEQATSVLPQEAWQALQDMSGTVYETDASGMITQTVEDADGNQTVIILQVVNQEELGGVQEVTHIDGDHITQEITMDGSDLGIEVPMEITAQDDQPVAMATTSGAMEGSMEGVVIDNGQVSASTTPTLALVSAAMATSMAEGSVIGADALAEAGTSMEPGVIATNMHGGIVTETGAMATSALECVETIETGEVTTTVVNMEASDVQTVQYIE